MAYTQLSLDFEKPTFPRIRILARTYEEARRLKINRYFTGEPCKHGHITFRYTKGCTCQECAFLAMKKSVSKNIFGALWRNAKSRAKTFGIEFAITKADITYGDCCPSCGVKFSGKPTKKKSGRGNSHSPSLDRIKPAMGYVRGNIAVICYRCNVLKRDATAQELRCIADWIDGVVSDAKPSGDT